MPIPQPILDDRSYQQLRDELVRKIHVYNPEWTDRNPSDPGITLIELFAFLQENLLYRFNQIPEKTKLEYLRLLQIPLKPAVSSRAMLSLTTKNEEGVLVENGKGVAKAGSILFEMENEVRALPVSVLAVCKSRCESPDETEDPELYAGYQNTIDALGGLEEGQDLCFEAKVVAEQGDGLPVDFGKAVDGMIWIAVLNESKLLVNDMRKKLAGKKGAPLYMNIGFVPDPYPADSNKTMSCPGYENANPPPSKQASSQNGEGEAGSPALEWEISRERADDEIDLDPNAAPIFTALKVEGDTTDGLTREGIVRLRLPQEVEKMGPYGPDDPVLAGTGDLPPALEENEDKLLFWLRVFHHGSFDIGAQGETGKQAYRFGKVLLVTANATTAIQQQKARPFFVGTGDGQPNQAFTLPHTPVIEKSLELEVEESTDSWTRWEEVDGFYGSYEGDRHYTLDREAGVIRFGNGLQGLAPQIGWRIRALSWRYGGGSAGNVPAKAINKFSGKNGVKVVNHLPAHGGGDTETLEKALARIPGELRRRDRAVTSDDFREQAFLAPGANVGRAETIPRFHPPTRNEAAAGVVTVVVWPADDPNHPNAPVPDRNLIEAVCRHLDKRRLVTTELYVIGPVYRKVAVSVGLEAKPGFGIEAVRNWVELVIRQYLSPLPPYGPEGEGWPLGRRVYGPELEAAALQVEGVAYLERLELAQWNENTGDWEERTDRVELAVDEVPALLDVNVVLGSRLPRPGENVTPPAISETSEKPIPVPVIKCEC